MGLGRVEHKGKGNAWENGGSRLGLGVGVGINVWAFIWVSQVGLPIGFDFKDLPGNLICG